MSLGHVPEPPYMAAFAARVNAIDGINCTEMVRIIRGTDWHTEVGSFAGTWGYFEDPWNRALTDYQIGGPWDGQYDGVIMKFIESDEMVAPYANGPVGKVRPPFDDVEDYLSTYGYGPFNEGINANLRSIELSDGGMPNRDRQLTGRQIESLAFQTAYIHAEQVGQDWSVLRYQCLHYQSGTDHIDCPGDWLKANKQIVRARAKDIMRAYQTNAPLSRPLLITYPPGWSGGEIAQPRGGVVSDTTMQLPGDLTVDVLERVFNPFKVRNPDTGNVAQFDVNGKISKAWLAHSLASIPAGANWTVGDFPPLVVVVRRGDGKKLWKFTDFAVEI